MAKESSFKAFDLHRKKPHTLPTPPAKITEHRLRRNEWTVVKSQAISAKGKSRTKRSTKAKRPAARAPRRAADVLRYSSSEIECLQCGKLGDDPTCGAKCYKAFRREHFSADTTDIKGPGPLGYTAATKPGVHLKKGQWVGEYIGELRPLTADNTSVYRFEVPGICGIDAEHAGNWTRFINSHCRPNVKPWAEFVGKRRVVLFRALRDVGPEEEITFGYGGGYFEMAGLRCKCDAFERPHMPAGGRKGRGQ